jgi:hypothetical protein
MSSDVAHGAQQQARIRQKKKPEYPDDDSGTPEIQKESLIELDLATADEREVNVGLKIRASQVVDEFKLWGRRTATGTWKVIRTTALTGSDLTTVQDQLNAVSPITYKDSVGTEKSNGEKWVVYKAEYNPVRHGFLFRTDLTLKPFNVVPKNGFQVVTTAFTYNTIPFDTGHYIVGTSVLPGEDSDFDHTTLKINAGKRKIKKGKKKKGK